MVRAQRRKFHFIYKTTCLITKCYYVGMHSTDDLNDDYFGSGRRLKGSVKRYGEENHHREILEMFDDRDALRNREAEIVNDELLKDELCMNILPGGKGGWDFINASGKGLRTGSVVSAATRQKISEANSGRIMSVAQRLGLSKNNPMKNPETVKKMSNTVKGRVKSEEHKAKIAASIRRFHQNKNANVV